VEKLYARSKRIIGAVIPISNKIRHCSVPVFVAWNELQVWLVCTKVASINIHSHCEPLLHTPKAKSNHCMCNSNLKHASSVLSNLVCPRISKNRSLDLPMIFLDSKLWMLSRFFQPSTYSRHETVSTQSPPPPHSGASNTSAISFSHTFLSVYAVRELAITLDARDKTKGPRLGTFIYAPMAPW
jgi:hypothetical protein